MKRIFLIAVGMFLLGTATVFAGNKTEKFEVNGNCGMCEKRIEKAAKSVDGVSLVDWDQETNMLTVALDSTKTNVHKVQMAIAKVGHDTPMHKATDEVYNELPGCCKYDRSAEKSGTMEKMHEGHMN